MDEVLELARELIARESVTPDDAGCQQLLVERLLPLGFEAEWFYCGDVTNVLLTHGRGSASLWFLGHTDVVPPGPLQEWTTPPFEPKERGGMLFGRGACDMKGAVAAMTVALQRFVEANPGHPGEVGLLLTSDEEGLAVDGIRKVAKVLRERGIAPDYCLVGEPSSRDRLGDTVRIGRRGSIYATLTVHGVQGHTALPRALDNPVHRLAPFLDALVKHEFDRGVQDGEGHFPPSHCQVANIEAGTGAMNVTPAFARVGISFRNNTNWTSEQLRDAVEDMLAWHDIHNFELDWWVSGEPFRSVAGPLREAVAGAVRDVLGIEPELNTGGGTSDGRFIAPLGSEVVEVGLVNASIHQIDEHASIEDLDRLTEVYLEVMERACR